MRIELGADYAPVYDDRIKTVIDDTIIPFFRKADLSAGAESGVLEIIKRSDLAGDETEVPGIPLGKYLAIAVIFTIAIINILPRFLARWSKRRRRCSNCGRHCGVSRHYVASRRRFYGAHEVAECITRCRFCGYEDRPVDPRPAVFVGSGRHGPGGGGGASGRW